MRRFFQFSLLITFVTVGLCAVSALAADSVNRKLVFPASQSMGTLRVEKIMGTDKENILSQTNAQGAVTLNVPDGYMVSMLFNPRTLENPKVLAAMPTDAIDALVIGYMSMDDDHVCDRALAQIPVFKHPLRLYLKRSDATDAGIMQFKSLSQLLVLNCFMGSVDGSFLSQWAQFKQLKYLNVGNDAVQEKYLGELCHLNSLCLLNLRHVGLKDKGLLEVCKMHSLQLLNIADNPQVTDAGAAKLSQLELLESLDLARCSGISDASMVGISKLTHLKDADLRGTKITAEGVKRLKSLKLERLALPQGYSRVQMNTLRQMMPSTKITFDNGDVDEEKRVQFAPLK